MLAHRDPHSYLYNWGTKSLLKRLTVWPTGVILTKLKQQLQESEEPKIPNWCNNVITFEHDDPEMIERIAAISGTDTGVLQTLVPCPEELLDDELTTSYGDGAKQAIVEAKQAAMVAKYGFKSWYDWCIANWGSKWDLCDVSFNRIDNNTIQISCDTAWGPPLTALERILEEGFKVHAYYYESGMQFAGIWDNGVDQCYQEWKDSAGAKAMLPQELDDTFAISESMAEYEEEERMEEELYAFVKEGAEKRAPTKINDED